MIIWVILFNILELAKIFLFSIVIVSWCFSFFDFILNFYVSIRGHLILGILIQWLISN